MLNSRAPIGALFYIGINFGSVSNFCHRLCLHCNKAMAWHSGFGYALVDLPSLMLIGSNTHNLSRKHYAAPILVS